MTPTQSNDERHAEQRWQERDLLAPARLRRRRVNRIRALVFGLISCVVGIVILCLVGLVVRTPIMTLLIGILIAQSVSTGAGRTTLGALVLSLFLTLLAILLGDIAVVTLRTAGLLSYSDVIALNPVGTALLYALGLVGALVASVYRMMRGR